VAEVQIREVDALPADVTMETRACSLLYSRNDLKTGFKYKGFMEINKIRKLKWNCMKLK
jgi:hypothetical protein